MGMMPKPVAESVMPVSQKAKQVHSNVKSKLTGFLTLTGLCYEFVPQGQTVS